jgi:hypothetical protein
VLMKITGNRLRTRRRAVGNAIQLEGKCRHSKRRSDV